MRTKTLLLTAALGAAGVATSMAQVYSVNMVGYINKAIPSGFSMVANQLNASPDNKITTLFASAPVNTAVFKFNAANGQYQSLQKISATEWDGEDLNLELDPGEGAFVQAPTAFNNTFVGEVQLSSAVPLNRGFQIISSALPQSLPLSHPPTAGAPNLAFPVQDRDEVYEYNPAQGGYVSFTFLGNPQAGGVWESESGAPPTPDIGESFFFNRPTGTPSTWNRTFSVGQ